MKIFFLKVASIGQTSGVTEKIRPKTVYKYFFGQSHVPLILPIEHF